MQKFIRKCFQYIKQNTLENPLLFQMVAQSDVIIIRWYLMVEPYVAQCWQFQIRKQHNKDLGMGEISNLKWKGVFHVI